LQRGQYRGEFQSPLCRVGYLLRDRQARGEEDETFLQGRLPQILVQANQFGSRLRSPGPNQSGCQLQANCRTKCVNVEKALPAAPYVFGGLYLRPPCGQCGKRSSPALLRMDCQASLHAPAREGGSALEGGSPPDDEVIILFSQASDCLRSRLFEAQRNERRGAQNLICPSPVLPAAPSTPIRLDPWAWGFPSRSLRSSPTRD